MEQDWDKVFSAKVKEIMTNRGCSITAAAEAARVKYPSLFKSYMNQLLFQSGQTYDGK